MKHSVTYDLTPKLYRTLLIANSWHQYRGTFIAAVLCFCGVIAISIYGHSVTGTNEVFVAWFPDNYPSLKAEHIPAALAYAADLARERIIPVPALP